MRALLVDSGGPDQTANAQAALGIPYPHTFQKFIFA